ncbi:hypothetical protein B0H12DRAFT_1321526 [Mycena haematopus]|nr:hypothetical protein B0H12DRAFT_1321526 [Mycena haematopus]
MPLEITTRVIKMHELQPCDSKIGMTIVHLPYAPVYQWGYGRMDASTPVLGLATSNVATCACVVFHCATTGRTVLAHSLPTIDSLKRSFVPLIDWVIGGGGKTYWSDSELENWLSGHGAKEAGVTVDAVILRGFRHESTQIVASLGPNQWIPDFRQFLLSSAASSRAFKVASCLDAPEVLKCASVLVDKITGRISCLRLESGSPYNFITIKNPHLLKQYSEAQLSQDRLVGIASLPKQLDLHLQYDVVSHVGAIPLPDEVRQLLRSTPALAITGILAQVARHFLEESIEAGRPCELCGDIGRLKCSACMGAWYCGKEHQLKDWLFHKAWCRSHKLVSSN